MKIDPLYQFKIHTLFPFFIGKFNISFTNAALFMIITVVVVIGWLCLGIRSSSQKLVPNRLQASVELLFNFINDLSQSYMGPKGCVFTPYILSIFLFILGGNLLGLLPKAHTFTSQLSVTLGLALITFTIITIIGFTKHGWGFFKIFMPRGVPLYIAPLLVPVEVISYLSRPVSLSIRLFANMVAGHIMLKIFSIFSAILVTTKWLGLSAILPIIMNIGVFGFELLVAVLQAYVFVVLTCIYLNDALHLH